MLPVLIAAASTAGKTAVVQNVEHAIGDAVSGLFGGGSNAKDGERSATAQSKLAEALAGDTAAAAWISGQIAGSATEVGRHGYRASWDRLLLSYPQLAVDVASTELASGALSNIHGTDSKDPERIGKAADALRRALAGDSSAVGEMHTMMTDYGTNAGRLAMKAAFYQLMVSNLALAQSAAQSGAAAVPTGFSLQAAQIAAQPTTKQLIGQSLTDLGTKLRSDLADTVQDLTAGAGSAAANAIAPQGSQDRVNIPTTKSNLALYLGGAAVVVLLLVLAFRRSK
jgi:hypothetical protein